MCNRISELSEKHEWSPLQSQKAMTLIDEPYALALHELGGLVPSAPQKCDTFSYLTKLSLLYSYLRLPHSYWRNMAHSWLTEES